MLQHFRRAVNTERTKRYPVPNTPPGEKPRTAAIGYFASGILRSVRTSDGRRYDGDELAMLECVVDDGDADGLSVAEIVVNYRKTNTVATYATTIEYLQQYGQRRMGVSGWELSMPRYLWSIDGNPPTGQPQPPPAPQPATQPALFDYAEPARRGGAY